MPELTKPQLNYLARVCIAELVGALEGRHGSTLAQLRKECTDEELLARFHQDEVEAYRLAESDVEKARELMEEAAAFSHVFHRVARDYPTMSKREQQKEARLQIKDPEVFAAAVENSRVYLHLLGGK